MPQFLLYGANGYTGKLVAEIARDRNLSPILAGRTESKIKPLAESLGFPYRIIDLEDTETLETALREVPVVLHCAGPFSHTADPMAHACLRTGTHYLDVTGELAVFEQLAGMDAEAKQAGVMLLPGVGFDVVPTDCMAAHLKSRMPDAQTLTLAFAGLGHLSHGTAKTAVENLDAGGMIRKNGNLVKVPAAHAVREIDFGRKTYQTVAIPWGDVSTAWYSTGIPNITVFAYQPSSIIRFMKMSRYMGWLLGSKAIQGFLKKQIEKRPAGPSPEMRQKGYSLVWGEVKDAAGNTMVSRMSGPEGYTLTAHAALAITEKVLAGNVKPGFQTPSRAYGKDLVLEVEGVEREDV